MAQKIIQQGAEANIYRDNNFILKERVKKNYRTPELDKKLRTIRTRSEAKLLEKASKIIDVPSLILTDEKNAKLKMDFIDGKKLSDFLDKFPLNKQKEICRTLGSKVAKLHDADIIHGDLTTSNMILVESKINSKNDLTGKRGDNNSSLRVGGWDRNNKFKVYLIDFGLGFISNRIEDKAVDLHLLKQALEAKHFEHWKDLFAQVIKGYSSAKNYKKVLEQLKKVESRGRYKEQY